MRPEKWQEIKDNVAQKFGIEDRETKAAEFEGEADFEAIIFNSPVGKVKLEFISRPVVLDRKTIYSNRIGSDTKVEYIYSDTERSGSMKAFRWNDAENDWNEIDASNFGS